MFSVVLVFDILCTLCFRVVYFPWCVCIKCNRPGQQVLQFTSSVKFKSGEVNDRAGGVITLLCADDFGTDAVITPKPVFKGRSMRIEVAKNSFVFMHWNIHNHELTLGEVRLIVQLVEQDRAFQPMSRHMLRTCIFRPLG